MNCLEFKRLALSDPSSSEVSFVEHSDTCPDCLKYVGEVRQLDADLAESLNVEVPTDLKARLKLATEMQEESEQRSSISRYAIAASVAIALFVGGFMVSNQFGPQPGEIGKDYQKLLAAVVEHVNEQPMTPVWGNARAERTVNTLMASYDPSLSFNEIENLQFGRICPMGKYRGLHATLESANGQTTFAYIKGEPVGEMLDHSYEGYVARVKPVRGGNLVIVSRTQQSVDQAEVELQKAMVWDI